MRRDAIEIALSAPIDWEVLETLVVEILQQDDLPRLRKLGGRADQGADAIDESFFGDESRTTAVVQVTSQRAQVDKLKRTIARLRETGIGFDSLVIVYRHPVASSVRTDLQRVAREEGVAVDIRDQYYLVSQLARPGSTIFSRYFGSLREQVDILLDQKDPLAALPDRLRHSMLASLGAYVLGPRSRLARQTLFEKTVLAALASSGETDIPGLVEMVERLLPEELVTHERVQAAVESLRRAGDCELGTGDLVRPSEKALVSLGSVIAGSQSAYESLLDYVIISCSRSLRLDSAMRGYIERNLRRAILTLFQAYGPIEAEGGPLGIAEGAERRLLAVLSQDVPNEVGRSALAAVAAYVRRPETWSTLAPFVRTYSALAIRNLDPVGRRWQQSVLSRTRIALDTDAVLLLLIEDLPEHPAFLRSVRELARSGIEIVVAHSVLGETVGNLSRANRTYKKFAASLQRMSPSMVDANVWHAVVRGYYYAMETDRGIGWRTYWERYYDHVEPEEYLRFVLGKRVAIRIIDLSEIPDHWLPDLEAISRVLLERKERSRPKAEFRDDEQMEERILVDVRMAMNIASLSDHSREANGYLASEDSAFRVMEQHSAWPPRPSVLIWTLSVPELAEFVCGAIVEDSEIVRLLFDPVVGAAAHLLAEEIRDLTAVGIDLRNQHVDRLEWDLQRDLKERLRGFQLGKGRGAVDRLGRAMDLVRSAQRLGYRLDPAIEGVVANYEGALKEAEEERDLRKVRESAIRRIARAAAGGSKRGKRRVNRVLRDLGIELDRLEAEAESDGDDGE